MTRYLWEYRIGEGLRFAHPPFCFSKSVGQLNDASKTEGEELLVDAGPAETLQPLERRHDCTENRRVSER